MATVESPNPVDIMSKAYRVSSADFKGWLDSEIWLNDCEKGLRREYIPALTHAVREWMDTIGYKMSAQWTPTVVAKWLYAISVVEVARQSGASLSYPEPCHRDWQEDHDMYSCEVDFYSVSEFLESFKTIEDLDYDTSPIGRRVYEELQRLIYCYIDMDNSRRGKQLAAKILDTDSDSDSSGSRRRRQASRRTAEVDVYLQEAKEGYHGGRGAKV